MTKNIPFLITATFFLLSLSAQTTKQIEKECRISSGLDIAGSTKHTKSTGRDYWLQLDYKFLRNVSIATEFENIAYKQPGYYENLPIHPNEIKVVNNNFSLLLKYHFATKSKMKFTIASGWTYSILTDDYYILESGAGNGGTDLNYLRNVSAFCDYRIPFLAEIQYPFSKNLNVEARIKYNLNPQNGNTYSVGPGLSLKL
ncbi:MAG: hypothetical protein ABI472_22900 [Ginsengibacter sp.]